MMTTYQPNLNWPWNQPQNPWQYPPPPWQQPQPQPPYIYQPFFLFTLEEVDELRKILKERKEAKDAS